MSFAVIILAVVALLPLTGSYYLPVYNAFDVDCIDCGDYDQYYSDCYGYPYYYDGYCGYYDSYWNDWGCPHYHWSWCPDYYQNCRQKNCEKKCDKKPCPTYLPATNPQSTSSVPGTTTNPPTSSVPGTTTNPPTSSVPETTTNPPTSSVPETTTNPPTRSNPTPSVSDTNALLLSLKLAFETNVLEILANPNAPLETLLSNRAIRFLVDVSEALSARNNPSRISRDLTAIPLREAISGALLFIAEGVARLPLSDPNDPNGPNPADFYPNFNLDNFEEVSRFFLFLGQYFFGQQTNPTPISLHLQNSMLEAILLMMRPLETRLLALSA